MPAVSDMVVIPAANGGIGPGADAAGEQINIHSKEDSNGNQVRND
jgi:hypothetical protein